MSIKYKIRFIRGAFSDEVFLDSLNPTIVKKYSNSWKSIEIVVVDRETVSKLQKIMVMHYDGQSAPWYLDGYQIDDKNKLIIAFGADDGENGRVFVFDIKDEDTKKVVKDYGISKGIPASQMDFAEVSF